MKRLTEGWDWVCADEWWHFFRDERSLCDQFDRPPGVLMPDSPLYVAKECLSCQRERQLELVRDDTEES